MLQIGSPVYATDGKVGVLQYVVLEPETQEVSDLIIKCDLFGDARVLSARHIDRVDDDGAIHLSVDKASVRRARKFVRAEFIEPEGPAASPGAGGRLYWQDIYGVMMEELPKPAARVKIVSGVDDDEVLVGKGSRVFTALGERVGSVDHVVIDKDARKLLYLVVRLPRIRHRRVVVAASQVKDWQPDAVVLKLDKEALYALPPYVPARQDATLARLVRQAIGALGVDVEHLGVFVDKGHVLLRGHSASQDDRRRIESATRSVPGVLSVTNEITTDRELELRVQQRLLADPVASLYPVDVIVKNRIATVVGKVPSSGVQDVILEIIRNTPDIVSVIDELAIEPQAFEEPVLPRRWIVAPREDAPEFVPVPQEP